MAATASELRRIYTNLFGEPERPEGLHDLQQALESLDRAVPTSRQAADRLLHALNGGADPELTFTQLECLRAVLSARAFAPLMPTADQSPQAAADLITLYKNLFAEPDLAHLRALQQAVFDYDQFGTEPKRLAVLALLRDLNPQGAWNDAHIGALDALLVRDITFKQIAPFQVTGDFW
jgi:hypothetical protein